jgi:glutamate-1-semialdehyde aminotransferase
MLCAYGPIILGYKEDEINDAVKEQMDKGFCFTMIQEVQNELEQKLIDLIPSAEQAVLAKTGSDGTTMAVRIARGYTGKDKILRCGYHGWHDWCVEVEGGVPEEIQNLTHGFKFGDLDQLKELLEEHKDNTACIIMTPIGHPLAKPMMEPPEGYLEAVRALADEYGVVLIFDEIRTGFRVALGGAQEKYGVTPDMSVFGKAMANGYPISAVVGKKEIMKVLEKEVFVSSTFFPNSLEMVAALKTIEIMERENVIEEVWRKGQIYLDGCKALIEKYDIPATVTGIAPMSFITFDKVDDVYKERRKKFYTETIRRGLFIQPYHHGYIAYRHTEEDIQKALDAIEEAFKIIKEEY